MPPDLPLADPDMDDMYARDFYDDLRSLTGELDNPKEDDVRADA